MILKMIQVTWQRINIKTE